MSAVMPEVDHIAEPGVYDIPDDVYHADPVPDGSLSSSGARRLLPPGCPALFKWELDNGRPEKRAFDFGHAAHLQVLGAGPVIVAVDAPDWRTKAAKAERDEAYAQGRVPLLFHEAEQVKAMAAALRCHPWAGTLFDPERGGKPEQSLFWQDADHDVWRRSRLDWLPATDGGRLIIPDYKSAVSALPSAFSKSAANYGYHLQADFYIDGVQALGIAQDVAFVFAVQEKTPPYLVTVVELDAVAMRLGHLRNQQALGVFAECQANDTWPGYSEDVELISLPRWATYDLEDIT